MRRKVSAFGTAIFLAVLSPMPCLSGDSVAAEPRADESYTLFVELREPYEKSRATLQKALKAEGYEAFAEGDREAILVLTAGKIRKLFGARIVHRTVEKSATHGTASQPFLEGARIPARFEKLIRRVYFDPQRG
jgi:hypothetical protein